MNKRITVFTPTFNRAFCLNQLYTSLVEQTNKNFIWLIVDDGSSDGTKNLIENWIAENQIQIQYFFQENQGMHSAHNTAYKNIKTELNVCIDSDDYMPKDAIEKIINLWYEKGSQEYAGIIGLDAFKDGTIINKIPDYIKIASLSELEYKNNIRGDKKIILRTEVVNEFPPYPIFDSERLVPLGTLYLMIDQKYKFLCTNEVFCIIEYLNEGSSKTIFQQYKKSPMGFMYSRIIELKYSHNIFYAYTRAIHYISSCFFTRKWNLFKDNPKKFITALAIPSGILFHVYVLFKLKK